MEKKKFGIVVGFSVIWVFSFLLSGCISVDVPDPPLAPNVSQFVITVIRSDSDIEDDEDMDMYLDGRKSGKPIKNGGQGQILVANGLHNLYVKIDDYQSQMITFEGNSEVIEFRTYFEGSRRNRQLNLVKTSGGK
jgi:hypothetical protein